MTSASSSRSFSTLNLASLRIRTIVGVGVVNVAAVAVVTVVAVAADVSNVMGTRGPPPCSATAPPATRMRLAGIVAEFGGWRRGGAAWPVMLWVT